MTQVHFLLASGWRRFTELSQYSALWSGPKIIISLWRLQQQKESVCACVLKYQLTFWRLCGCMRVRTRNVSSVGTLHVMAMTKLSQFHMTEVFNIIQYSFYSSQVTLIHLFNWLSVDSGVASPFLKWIPPSTMAWYNYFNHGLINIKHTGQLYHGHDIPFFDSPYDTNNNSFPICYKILAMA